MAKSVSLPLPGRLRAARRRDAPSLRLPFLLTLPTLIVVFVIFGIPLVYSLALSLHRINMLTQQWVFVGLQNYLDILPNPDFLAALGRTAYFAVVTVIGGLILGFAMALVLNQNFPGRNFLRSVVLVPWAMAPVAVGVLWSWMLNGEYGTFNAVLFDLGLIDSPIHWLADGRLAFNMVALAHVWNQAPLASLLILAGLQSIPENLHRAARIDGAGAVRRFFSITLPWLRPDAAADPDPDHDQLDHGVRSVLDHDPRRAGQRHHRVLLDGLRLCLPVLQVRRGRGDPLRADHPLPDPGRCCT